MITTADLMNAIQERMTDKNMTQRDLALKAGMSQPHLCNLFNGKVKNPQLATVLKLCDAAGIKVQFITPRQAAK